MADHPLSTEGSILWITGPSEQPRLRRVVSRRGERLLYCDYIYDDGEGLFHFACEHDLGGIVAERKTDPYLPEDADWLKIRNSNYSQWVGRKDLFEHERESNPDTAAWPVEWMYGRV